MITVGDIMRIRKFKRSKRFLLFRTDQRHKELIDSYDLIRQARKIAIEGEYSSYEIYDTLEDRLLIEYDDRI